MTLTSTSRSEHYEQARRINSVLRVYGEVLLRATSTAVFQGAGKYKYYMIGGQAVWIAVWPQAYISCPSEPWRLTCAVASQNQTTLPEPFVLRTLNNTCAGEGESGPGGAVGHGPLAVVFVLLELARVQGWLPPCSLLRQGAARTQLQGAGSMVAP